MMEGMFYSAGFHGTVPDKDGLPQLTYTEASTVERIDEFVQNIRTLMNSPECHILQKADMKHTQEHKTVFYAATLDFVADIGGDEDIAIIPLPKLDENQENYCTSRDHGYDQYSVPVTASDVEAADLRVFTENLYSTSWYKPEIFGTKMFYGDATDSRNYIRYIDLEDEEVEATFLGKYNAKDQAAVDAEKEDEE